MTKQTQDAYIVAVKRTPVGKAPRGVFRNTRPDDLLAHVIKAALADAPPAGSTLRLVLRGGEVRAVVEGG